MVGEFRVRGLRVEGLHGLHMQVCSRQTCQIGVDLKVMSWDAIIYVLLACTGRFKLKSLYSIREQPKPDRSPNLTRILHIKLSQLKEIDPFGTSPHVACLLTGTGTCLNGQSKPPQTRLEATRDCVPGPSLYP